MSAKPAAIASYELQLCNAYNKLSVFEDHYEVNETTSCFCGAFRLYAGVYMIPKQSVLFITRAYRNSTLIFRLIFLLLGGIALAAAFTGTIDALWVIPAAALLVLIVYLILSDRVVNVNIALRHTASPFGVRQFFLQLSSEDAAAAYDLLSQDQLLLVRSQPSFGYGAVPPQHQQHVDHNTAVKEV